MYDTILVATDGSAAAETAVRSAIALAERFDAAVHAVHVMEMGELPPGVEDADADAFAGRGRTALEEFATAAEEAGIEAGTAMLDVDGPTHRGIVDYATDNGVDLVVVGTHGRTGLDRFVLGSVAENTLRSSPVPVLTVHEDTPLDPAVGDVVVPTDGSETASRAARHAIDVAVGAGVGLHVVNVVDLAAGFDDVGSATVLEALEDAGQAAVDEVVSMAEEAGVEPVEGSVLSGRPHEAIVDYAAEVDAGLLVVGTHGRSGLDRLLLGSIAERVVRTAGCPVLGVPGAGQ